MGVTTENIRNVAISGHGSTGKTIFTESLLFTSGAITKMESIDSGKTVSDYHEEEIANNFSTRTSLCSFNWQDTKFNVLDTPGASDFVGEVVSSFRCAESSVILVGARSGVQIETIKLWRRLENRKMPRIVFVNKMDKDRADYEKTVEELRDRFKKTFIPVTLPIGSGNEFKGIIDLITMKAYMIPEPGQKEVPVEIPADMADIVEQYHESLIESAAEGDDELTEKYFDEGTLTIDEVKKGLMEGIRDNKLIPVLCGASELCSGMVSILDFLVTAAPSPNGIHESIVNENNEESDYIISKNEPVSLMMFKTTVDQFSGKLSYIKVMGGELKPDSELINQREGKKEKLSKLYTALGKKLVEVDSIMAGDLGIVTKISSAQTNDTFCENGHKTKFKVLALPQPVHSVAIEATSKKDEDKLAQLLQRAIEEDKTFQMKYNPETKETVISGMGELHLNMILDKIREKQKIEVETKVPRVAYRETITKSAESEYTHKKQSGGHGQYARVLIDIKPIERGKYFEFSNDIKGGSVSKGYMPGVEKGLLEGMEHGILAGYPIVDVGVRIFDGKEHPVDSSEMAFKIAARGALKEAVSKAKPVLLEPIMKLNVFIEEEYLGDILSDMSSRRGRVLGQEPLGGGIMEVDALVPQGELLRYSIDLRSITSGTGAFEVEFSHYDPISGKIADDVIKEAEAMKQED